MKEGHFFDMAKTHDVNRGRKESRTIFLYKPRGEDFAEWPSVKTVICIDRKRKIGVKLGSSRHYYVTSLEGPKAKNILTMIRKHWWVENKLHWVKDVILEEDTTKFQTRARYRKNSVFRNVMFNFIKLNGYKSIKLGMEEFTNNIYKCLEIIRT